MFPEYQANNDLAQILIKHGFIETTSPSAELRGMKSFKLSKLSHKGIYFDHINIGIKIKSQLIEIGSRISSNQLKLILLYFKLSATELKEFSESGKFQIPMFEERLEQLYKELEDLKKFNINNKRQSKIEKILAVYESLKL